MKPGFDVMVLAPHPDDAEMACAGTILQVVAAGGRVAVVDMTRGEMGTRGSAETRDQECEAATRLLGIEHRANLGLPDAFLRDDDESLAAVVAGSMQGPALNPARARPGLTRGIGLEFPQPGQEGP